VEFSDNFKMSRSPDIEIIFLEKAWSFSIKEFLRWVGHSILRPFLRKAWSFLRILRWVGHLILRSFLGKAWSFLNILR
jgi:hypothetical protein